MPQVTELAMGAAGPDSQGLASGVVNTTQQAGGVVGLAVVAGLAAAYGRSAGFLAAAGVLALGAATALYLTARAGTRTRPETGPDRAGGGTSPTLDTC
jgi:hypothetical protein